MGQTTPSLGEWKRGVDLSVGTRQRMVLESDPLARVNNARWPRHRLSLGPKQSLER